MALLPILTYPDPRLRTVATPVTEFDEALAQLASDMLETMYDSQGIGLAATQVNVHKRVLVADTSPDKKEQLVFVNPQIVGSTGEQQYDEGCLSVPGFAETINRHETITVKAFDVKGQPFELSCDGLLSVCIQHEIDHLNGKLFVDYITDMKRQRIKKALSKR